MTESWIRIRRPLRHGAAAVLAAVATLLLASCGGGTSQVSTFSPTRVIAFGDEYSSFERDGSRYTINSVTTTGEIECDVSPTWVQVLASEFSLSFPECNLSGDPDPQALSFAVPGAMVEDVVGQIESYTASGGTFDGLTLVTVLAGTNDVLEQYPFYETQGEGALLAEMRRRGERLAEGINSIVNAGAKVIISTTPDVGTTPFAFEQRVTFTDTDRAALLSRMTDAMNSAMLLKLPNDGRKIGLVLADDLSRTSSRFPGSFGLSNSISGACDEPLPTCTSETLVPDATISTHMWADDTRLGPTIQGRIGQQASDRARNNPF